MNEIKRIDFFSSTSSYYAIHVKKKATSRMKKRKTKVFLLQRIIPNYRIPVFQRLSGLEKIKLTVFYSQSSQKMQKENLKNAEEITGFDSIKIHLFETQKTSYQFGFLKHILKERPDVVIGREPEAWDSLLFLICCKILRIKLLWWQGGMPYIDKAKIQGISREGKFAKIFGKYNPRRWLSFQSDGMIVYSEHAKQYYSSLGFKKAIFVAPNSPDTEKLIKYKNGLGRNSAIIKKLRGKYSPKGEKIIFMLGRLNKDRKTALLINAFEIVQKKQPLTSLVIIGDGSERHNLEYMVKEKSLKNVYFLGEIYDDAILARYFMVCDIYVTPGGASLSIKMAMTFGKPVVSVAYGLEVHSIENGRNGFVVPTDDSEGLAEKIMLLLNDDGLRIRMGRLAEETILKRINITKMIEGFEVAIQRVSDVR